MITLLWDPVLRAPLLGSMLMCFSAALVGVFILFQRRSLVGETLSHAAYPGVVLAAFLPINILLSAFVAILLGLYFLNLLEKKWRVKSDVALCFVLSSFFGIGVLLASRIQFISPLSYQAVQIFLYGQAATLRDFHLILYGGLSLVTLVAIFLFYRPLAALHFDPDFAHSLGLPIKRLRAVLSLLLALAIVIGIRSVGIVLMSAMLIAPPVAARAFTKRLAPMLTLSAFFGLVSGFGGTALPSLVPGWAILPTGPTIVVIASILALFSLLLAPERGLLFRYGKLVAFRIKCRRENIMKALPTRRQDLGYSFLQGAFLLSRLKQRGWCYEEKGGIMLTPEGEKEKRRLIRLHRLWEVYLVHMGQDAKRVHSSAEEMEHILSGELEEELTTLLGGPTMDPHQKPIPERPL